MKRLLLPLLMTAVISAEAALSDHPILPLWPEGVPGAKALGPEKVAEGERISNVSEPTLMLFRPAVDRPNGTAIIIAPGGGYGFVSYDREGVQFANWLSSLGVTCFVLKYRLAEFGHPAPLQDVLRAVRLVRSQAAAYKINPARVGVMGSSAGGHLAASAATLFDHPAGKTGAPLDAVSARPDFVILMYPVITMGEPTDHAGSRKNLLGANPTPEMLKLMSVEKQVTAATPPTLLIHTQEDATVPVANSLVFYEALTRAKVPAEMYIFERGGHGMGFNPNYGTASDWTSRAADWLRNRGLLTAVKP